MYGRFGLISHNILGFEASILGWKSLWAVQTLTHFPFAALAIERALAMHAGKAGSSSAQPRGRRGYRLQDSYPAVWCGLQSQAQRF